MPQETPSCQADPDLWFSTAEDDRAAARRVCAECPLLDACGRWAAANPDMLWRSAIYAGRLGREILEEAGGCAFTIGDQVIYTRGERPGTVTWTRRGTDGRWYIDVRLEGEEATRQSAAHRLRFPDEPAPAAPRRTRRPRPKTGDVVYDHDGLVLRVGDRVRRVVEDVEYVVWAGSPGGRAVRVVPAEQEFRPWNARARVAASLVLV